VDGSLLAGVMATARDAWPNVRFDEAAVAAFFAERLDPGDPDKALAATPVADLALAAACVAQEPTAHAAFDGILAEVEFAGASVRARPDLVDDVKQMLRVQLLVAKDGKPPGLVGYRGKGPLRGWVRITATRELIRQAKKRAREAPLEPDRELVGALGGVVDPALDALKAEYRTEFAEALRAAIDDLDAEDRTLLRQQIVENLSIDEVGAAFGVHRATAARWLSRARGALVSATHKRLAERLKVSVDEIDSVMRLVSSQLDASVVRMLRDKE
jgi:RNA polymerase sigma-70 factor (ECF subfamily)